jgi:hypothetical protein
MQNDRNMSANRSRSGAPTSRRYSSTGHEDSDNGADTTQHHRSVVPRALNSAQIKPLELIPEPANIITWQPMALAQLCNRVKLVRTHMCEQPGDFLLRYILCDKSALEQEDEWLGTTLLSTLAASPATTRLKTKLTKISISGAPSLGVTTPEPRALTSGHLIWHAIHSLISGNHHVLKRRDEDFAARAYLIPGESYESALAAIDKMEIDSTLCSQKIPPIGAHTG